MKLFIINVGCFFFNCLVYFLMKEVYLRFFPEDGEFFCVLRFLWKPTFDWISIWHSRHALISIAIWKYIKESYLNKKCFFLIIEVFLDSMYMPYTHGAKRLQAMDDMKYTGNFRLCGYGFFKFTPARFLKKPCIFNGKDNCEFQQTIY